MMWIKMLSSLQRTSPQQLENRISFRRAMKSCMQRTMRNGALGIKASCSGRLGGADMARTEFYSEGNDSSADTES